MEIQRRSLALQETMVNGLGQLSQGIAVLTNTQARMMESDARRTAMEEHCRLEDAERGRVDAERRAAEAERHASLLAAVAHKR
jgi:hypothetical protein